MITVQDSDDMFDLFYTPSHKLVRRDDPVTSHEAAESVDTSHMATEFYVEQKDG